jgi:hypothetical protein
MNTEHLSLVPELNVSYESAQKMMPEAAVRQQHDAPQLEDSL